MDAITLDDFTGGISKHLAASDFTGRQWTTIKGLVLEDDWTLRSQWRIQKLGLDTLQQSPVWVQMFRGDLKDFLVIAESGTLWYTVAPEDTMVDNAIDDLTWTQLDQDSPGFAPDGDNPGAIVPLQSASSEGFRAGLASVALGGSGGFVHQSDDSPSELAFLEVNDSFPNDSAEGDPATDVLPRAAHSCSWNDTLVLGDIRWLDDTSQALSSGNNKRFKNGLWLAQPGDPSSFAILDVVFVGHPELEIVGMVPVDLGLLVFKRGAAGAGSVWLLRGTPDSFVIEVLREGLGAQDVTFWPHTGSAVFTTDDGEVWATNGDELSRLDTESLRLSNAIPDPQTSALRDRVACVGENVLWYRATLNRLFCFRLIGDGGAWTELVMPNEWDSIKHMWASGLSVYFVTDTGGGSALNRAGDELWRITTHSDHTRGYSNGVPVVSELTTPTLSSEDHTETFWHEFGVRCQNVSDLSGTLLDLTAFLGPADDPADELVTTIEDSDLVRQEQVAVAGGPSVEASFRARFDGDVEIESMTVYVHKARRSRASERVSGGIA